MRRLRLTQNVINENDDDDDDAGDAYRYTLQPIYHDVDRSFRCHLRPRAAPPVLYQLWFYITVPGTPSPLPALVLHHRAGHPQSSTSCGSTSPCPAPPVFYELWFYITVPGTGFETDRLYAPVGPGDVSPLGGGRAARRRVEFVTVDNEPATGADVDGGDLVLRARRRRAGDGGWRYTAGVVRTAAAHRRRSSSFHLQHVADNVVVTSTTFAEPFAHSTSTWVAGDNDRTTTRCAGTSLVMYYNVKVLECGPMPNVMVALPNTGGALCSTPQSLADAH